MILGTYGGPGMYVPQSYMEPLSLVSWKRLKISTVRTSSRAVHLGFQKRFAATGACHSVATIEPCLLV